jgi:predicted deacylase
MRLFIACKPVLECSSSWFAAALLLAAILIHPSAAGALPAREKAGHGVTAVRRLSDYESSLGKTPGDTTVYILDSGVPGGTLLVVGGTHADETAGTAAALALVQHATPTAGRIIVVPRANNSAAGGRGPGQRLTKPADQGRPDPVLYYPPGSTLAFDGYESRNLDRAYPGAPDGTLTERIASGIMKLLWTEGVDIAIDLHESPPASPLSMSIIAHERALGIAALAVLDLEDAGIDMHLEGSPAAYPGLSHREWGDRTGALAFIVETPNPAMGDGKSSTVQADDILYPLQRRVEIHLGTVAALVVRYNDEAGVGRAIHYVTQ